MREVVLDTETTGLSPESGDRLVEIGCVELVNLVPTGQTFHQYINPERAMSAGAEAVHGLGDAFLADKPTFAEVVEPFLAFIGDAKLVIHNASFDMAFLNAELRRMSLPPLPDKQAVDTLKIARQRYPGAQASLDALCRRFGIDNSQRDLHGALLDAQLLAEVYLELKGGRQPDLTLVRSGGAATGAGGRGGPERTYRPARPHAPTPQEVEAHVAFLEKLADPVWTRE